MPERRKGTEGHAIASDLGKRASHCELPGPVPDQEPEIRGAIT